MHETLENFDSQEALVQQTNNIALKLNATMNGISDISEAWGVFDAFDNIMGGIHGISVGVGKVPLRIKTYLTGMLDFSVEFNVILGVESIHQLKLYMCKTENILSIS